MIWWFYRALKDYKLAPCVKQAQLLRARFDRIFKRASTGYVTLDRLLRRLFAQGRLLRVSNARRYRSTPTLPKRHPRLRHEKKNLCGPSATRPRRARHHAGLAKTCMKLKCRSTNSRRPPRHPRPKSRPSQASSPAPHKSNVARPGIAPFTLIADPDRRKSHFSLAKVTIPL